MESNLFRDVVVRLYGDGVTGWVNHDISGDQQIAFGLYQGFDRIAEKHIVREFVNIFASGPFSGEMPKQDVWAGVYSRRGIICFGEQVVPDDRLGMLSWHAYS